MLNVHQKNINYFFFAKFIIWWKLSGHPTPKLYFLITCRYVVLHCVINMVTSNKYMVTSNNFVKWNKDTKSAKVRHIDYSVWLNLCSLNHHRYTHITTTNKHTYTSNTPTHTHTHTHPFTHTSTHNKLGYNPVVPQHILWYIGIYIPCHACWF